VRSCRNRKCFHAISRVRSSNVYMCHGRTVLNETVDLAIVHTCHMNGRNTDRMYDPCFVPCLLCSCTTKTPCKLSGYGTHSWSVVAVTSRVCNICIALKNACIDITQHELVQSFIRSMCCLEKASVSRNKSTAKAFQKHQQAIQQAVCESI
jgi:hypothetical protein